MVVAKIKIDFRENELINTLKTNIENVPKFKNIELCVQNLHIGDIVLALDDKDYIIIERKTVSDLASSIKDGRYEEQSFRLDGSEYHNHNIMYLIEGDLTKMPNYFKNNIDKMTLYSALFSLNYFKGFSVLRTINLVETAIFICNSLIKLHKSIINDGKLPYYKDRKIINNNIVKDDLDVCENNVDKSNTMILDLDMVEEQEDATTDDINVQKNKKDYVDVVKKVKKDNITKQNIGEILLCQIPGVSTVSAKAIMSKFSSVSDLIFKLKEDKTILNKIYYTTSKGQTKVLTKTCISGIIRFLADSDEAEN